MQRKVGFLALFGISVLSLVLPSSAESTLSDSYDNLFLLLTIVSAFVLLLVMVLWGYFMYQFRESNEEIERKPISHETSRKLEVGWTAVAILIVLILMFASYPSLFGQFNDAETKPVGEEITVIGTGGWAWVYQLQNGTFIQPAASTPDNPDRVTNITLEVGTVYTFEFYNQASFIHSYYVEALNIKMDVIPGVNNTYTFEITETGEFPVLCTEFCGEFHSNMKGWIIAVPGGSL